MKLTSEDRDNIKRLLIEWRKDPVLFVKQQFGVTPTEQQAKLLSAVAKPGSRVSVKSGHGCGKTTCLAWLIIWLVMCHDDVRVPCTAPTAPQLEAVLWAECVKWWNKLRPEWKQLIEVTRDRVFAVGDERSRFAVARTARKGQGEALQGFHGSNVCFLLDEASGIDESVFGPVEGALSTPGSRIVMTSNPTRNIGFFHRSHNAMRHLWDCITFSCLESPLVSKEYIETMAAQYGTDSDLYRVRVLGEFGSASSMQLIGSDVVEAALGRVVHLSAYQHAPIVLGVDVARYGSCQSVIFLRQGLHSRVVGAYRNMDLMTLASLIDHHWLECKAEAVFIDEPGLGAGVIDRLRQIGRAPIAVNGGKKAAEENKYINKRAEMWVRMRDWLRDGGCLPDNQDLLADLTGVEYGYDSKERLQLERKEDMLERGLASPDLADALSLTFSERIHRPITDRSEAYMHNINEVEEWRPFN